MTFRRVSPARFERALPTSSTSCLLPLGYEDPRAASRCRTGPSAVRRRSRKPCAAARGGGDEPTSPPLEDRSYTATPPGRPSSARWSSPYVPARTTTSDPSRWGTWARTRNLVIQSHARCRNCAIPHCSRTYAGTSRRLFSPVQPARRAVRMRWQLAQIRSHFSISVCNRAHDHLLMRDPMVPIFTAPSR